MASLFRSFRINLRLFTQLSGLLVAHALQIQSAEAYFSNSTTSYVSSPTPQTTTVSQRLFSNSTLANGSLPASLPTTTSECIPHKGFSLESIVLEEIKKLIPTLYYLYERKDDYASCATYWGSSLAAWVFSPHASTTPSIVTKAATLAGDAYTRTYNHHKISNKILGTFDFAPSEPCCLQCTVFGGDVQVYRWPTPAPSPPVTKLVNTDGYTFLSPSVYVRFESLHATDFCGDMDQPKNATTIAFDPEELSTTTGYRWNTAIYSIDPMLVGGKQNFTRAVWGDQTSCGNKTEVFWQIHHSKTKYSALSQLTSAWSEYASHYCDPADQQKITDKDYDQYTVTYNPCMPTLSVPKKILSLNSLWSECAPGISGFYDPPSYLTAGTGFKPGGPVNAPISTVAAPGSSPSPAIASATVAPETKPTPTQTSLAAPGPAVGNNGPAPSPAPNGAAPVDNPIPPQNGAPGPAVGNNGPTPSSNGAVPVDNPIPSPHGAPPPHDPAPADDSLPENGAHPGTDPHSSPAKDPALVNDPPQSDNMPQYLIGSQTVALGSVATISGTAVSLQPGGLSAVVDSKTLALDGYLSRLDGGASVVVGGKTQSVGGSSEETSLVVGGKTMPLSALAGELTADASVVVGSKTMPVSAFLAQVTGDPKVVIGATTMPLSALHAGMTGDASVVIGSRTVPLSAYLGEIGAASPFDGSATGVPSLAAIIASMESVSTSVMSSKTSSRVPKSGNGTISTGQSSALLINRGIWISGLIMSGTTVVILLL